MSPDAPRTLKLALAAFVVVAGFGNSACADARSNALKRARMKAARNDRERRENLTEAAVKAQGEIQKDRNALAEAAAELDAARSALRLAGKKKSDVVDELTRREEQQAGLAKARDAQESAKSALDIASKPVLEALRRTPEFAAATSKAETARRVLAEIQADASLSEDDRTRRQLAASEDSFAVSTLERTTLQTDASTKPLVEKLEAARTVVADLNQQVKKSVESDPKVRAAESGIEEARHAVEGAEARVMGLQSKIAAAEARLTAGIVDRSARSSPSKSATTKKSGS
jgi:hypothetical protein